jgi:hypothetical protein
MRKYVTYALVAMAMLAIGATAQAADHPQKPGKWKMTFQVEMPSMPVKIPPVTKEICITEEDLKDPTKSVPGGDPKMKCDVSNYKIDGKTITWEVNCPKQNMKGHGEVTYTDDSYAGAMNMMMGEQEMTTKFSGKWLGACEK